MRRSAPFVFWILGIVVVCIGSAVFISRHQWQEVSESGRPQPEKPAFSAAASAPAFHKMAASNLSSVALDSPEKQAISFVEAFRACPNASKCNVAGDPWQEYRSISADDPAGGEKRGAILNFLMRNLDNLDFRRAAERIIEVAFPPRSPLHYRYRGDFMQKIGKIDEAEKLYEQLIAQHGNTGQVPWLNLGNFYMSIEKYQRALDCFENERAWMGKRLAVQEDFPTGAIEHLERRITEARDALTR